jgi:hypothetical protein
MKTFKHKGHEVHKVNLMKGFSLIIRPTLVPLVSFVFESL